MFFSLLQQFVYRSFSALYLQVRRPVIMEFMNGLESKSPFSVIVPSKFIRSDTLLPTLNRLSNLVGAPQRSLTDGDCDRRVMKGAVEGHVTIV